MALLPPFYLDAVVALGVGNDPATRSWIGTGFLYGVWDQGSSGEDKGYYVFLMTCKHVLDGHDNIWVKFNVVSGSGSQDINLLLRAKNGRED